MNKSENIGNLAKALSIVQSKLNPASKDADNPFFKSKYADLNSVWESCRALLAENGLAVTQVNQATDLGVIVETVLMHESGEWLSGEILLPLAKRDAQGVGSAITYGRRYGLASIVGVVAGEDDDGNGASQLPKQQQQNPPASQRLTPTQEKEIFALCNSTGSLSTKVAEHFSANRTQKVEELTRVEADKAINGLKKKPQQENK